MQTLLAVFENKTLHAVAQLAAFEKKLLHALYLLLER